MHPGPVLLYDGDCGFCRSWIARWCRFTGDRVAYVPYQEAGSRFSHLDPRDLAEAVHLVEPDGRTSRGAEAVFRTLAQVPGNGWALFLYKRLPGAAPVSEAVYRWVARHRSFASGVTRVIWGKHVVPPGERLTAWVFLRVLGLVYAIAFLSLAPQVRGLIGSEGILPVRGFLDAVHGRFGFDGYRLAPTLAWIGNGDGFLLALCAAGTGGALLLTAGLAPGPLLTVLYVLYLSLCVAGQDFLWFQWDGLLLEAGFFSLFIAPWRRWSRPGTDPPPSRAGLWLLRWLLFRLMIASAAAKLASGDPAWRSLTALQVHFETQPIPTGLAWYVHHLPPEWLRLAARGMFAVEGLVPLLIFAPRRLRFAGAALLAAFQILIALTGNYGFFNLLTLALCILLLDDAVWPGRRGKGPAEPPGAAHRGPGRLIPRIRLGAVLLLVALSLVPTATAFSRRSDPLGFLRPLYTWVAPFRVANPYGLFAVMTPERPEIEVQGSEDGASWRSYAFRWKAGDLSRRPPFVAPYMPRLDWQMWFAALGRFPEERWFPAFALRLLEGSPPVLGLLEENPFPEHPPRYVRGVLYDYRFTTPQERRATGAWWRRQERGLYAPVLTLEGGRLRVVEGKPENER